MQPKTVMVLTGISGRVQLLDWGWGCMLDASMSGVAPKLVDALSNEIRGKPEFWHSFGLNSEQVEGVGNIRYTALERLYRNLQPPQPISF